MTGNKGVLANFKEKKFSAQVELRDNVSYPIEGIGSTSFQLASGVSCTLMRSCTFLV
jgi:hypothetical protein